VSVSLAVLKARRLTVAERSFADLYSGMSGAHPEARLDATLSAALAGLPPPHNVTGAKMLRRPHVWRAIDRRMGGHIAGPRAVLTEISRLALQPDTVKRQVLDADGRLVEVDAPTDARAKARMLELLGRRYGATQSPVERKVEAMLALELQEMQERREQSRSERARELPRRSVRRAAVIDVHAEKVDSVNDRAAGVRERSSMKIATAPAALPRPSPAAVIPERAPWSLPPPSTPRPRRHRPRHR
jgi:hypothetical protein